MYAWDQFNGRPVLHIGCRAVSESGRRTMILLITATEVTRPDGSTEGNLFTSKIERPKGRRQNREVSRLKFSNRRRYATVKHLP